MNTTDFNITSVSYIGRPISKTAMYITKKVEHLLTNLFSVDGCLVFCEDTILVDQELAQKHSFVLTPNPQLEYAKYVRSIFEDREKKRAGRNFTLTQGGYYIGENVTIGSNSIIEPLCFIDHDVVIGKNARLYSGVKIRNAIIGDCFVANENAVIGVQAFTMAIDEDGNKFRMPSLGRVMIGNNVEVGMLASIAMGSAGNTILEDFVKIDAFAQIAHDVKLEKNVEILSGVILGGFVSIGENAFVAINSTVRNRVTIGQNAVIGMGSVVTKNVGESITVIGNPARPMVKK